MRGVRSEAAHKYGPVTRWVGYAPWSTPGPVLGPAPERARTRCRGAPRADLCAGGGEAVAVLSIEPRRSLLVAGHRPTRVGGAADTVPPEHCSTPGIVTSYASETVMSQASLRSAPTPTSVALGNAVRACRRRTAHTRKTVLSSRHVAIPSRPAGQSACDRRDSRAGHGMTVAVREASCDPVVLGR